MLKLEQGRPADTAQYVVNSFGSTVVSAFTITNRIEQLINQPYNSLCAALTTYAGQNMGAGKTDRVRLKDVIIMAAMVFIASLKMRLKPKK